MSSNLDFVAEEAPEEGRERRAVKPPHSSAGFQTCATTQTRGRTRRDFLGSAAAGMLVAPWLGPGTVKAQVVDEPGQRQRIEAAIPTKAFITPRKPRKLLVFDLNVGYGGHRSIPTANLAFMLMGAKTGAFETVISRDPSVFNPESLRQFDAVFLNNTIGPVFDTAELQASFRSFMHNGGGLVANHAVTVTSEDWPEFGEILGARGASHRDADEKVVIKLDDPTSPLNAAFARRSFEFTDEIFRLTDPYSREKVHVLLSIDVDKTDMNQGAPRGKCFREDKDYAISWIHSYGRGRVFYCSLGHNPYVFWDPVMLKHFLAGIQFALGDLKADTTPSARRVEHRNSR